MAAKNARLIFSRISAEEEEDQSDPYSSEKVESDTEELLSSRESLHSEEEDKLMEKLEDSPSMVSQIRLTRSHRSEMFRVPSRRPLYNTEEAVHLEERRYSSPSGGKKLDDESVCREEFAETVNSRQNSSTQVTIREQKSGDIQGKVEVDEVSSPICDH